MMMQPKFRGFSKEMKNWVYGFGWYETDYTDEYLEELKQEKQDAVLFTNSSPVICTIASMGQYTGLKDKEGNEIYDGDVLSYWGFTYVVVYQDAGFGWNEDGEFHSFPSMAIDEIGKAKIIGNIHENPELTA
ncbi:YopX family protein [Solibacillus isronensis]|uniref:YopX family protein n=1 Tax=Solibacillus isronensis TaxID=412383 RepID=UPI0039A3691C